MARSIVFRTIFTLVAGTYTSRSIAWNDDACFCVPKHVKVAPINMDAMVSGGNFVVAIGFDDVNNENAVTNSAYESKDIIFLQSKGVALLSSDVVMDSLIQIDAKIPEDYLRMTVRSVGFGAPMIYSVELTCDLIDYTPTSRALLSFGPDTAAGSKIIA